MISENKSLNENVGIKKVRNSSITEESGYPVGYLTVVKNAGKPTEEIICDRQHNLLTTEGKAWVHDQLYQLTSGQTGGANYIGLTNDASYTPAASDTRTTWEAIEEVANGLERITGSSVTKSYSAGTSKSTLLYLFTCSTSAVAGIRASALLNNTRASGTSKLVHTATFTSVDLEVSDTLTVTWEITLS